jgi:hypothetical protein
MVKFKGPSQEKCPIEIFRLGKRKAVNDKKVPDRVDSGGFAPTSHGGSQLCRLNPALTPVFLVAHLLHPVDRFAVELFLNRDVRHRRCRRGAMPMLFPGREPDHIAWPNFLNRPAFALRSTAARCHDQPLA